MNIVLTGETGSGKTTVCLKILENLKLKNLSFGGVLTPGNFDGSREIIDVCTGEKLPFCRLRPFSEGAAIGKYFFNEDAFDFGIKAVSHSIDEQSAVTFIDELGPLELSGSGFAGIFRKLNTSAIKNLLLVVRLAILDRMAEKFDFYFRIFETTDKNRECLAEEITEVLDK